jgi:hypothetical protein
MKVPQWTAGVVAGSLSGLVAAVVAGRFTKAAAPPVTDAPTPRAVRSEERYAPAVVEERMRESPPPLPIQQERTAPDDPTAALSTTDNAPAPDASASPETIEQSTDRHRDRWEQLRLATEMEPVDSSWAAPLERQMRGDLRDVAREHSFEFRDVSCHTDHCIATFEWPNYRAASSTYDELLRAGAPSTQRCTRTVLLVRPANEDLPYEGQMILRCRNPDAPEAIDGRP